MNVFGYNPCKFSTVHMTVSEQSASCQVSFTCFSGCCNSVACSGACLYVQTCVDYKVSCDVVPRADLGGRIFGQSILHDNFIDAVACFGMHDLFYSANC